MHCQLDRRRALRGWRGFHPHVEHIPRLASPCAHEVLARVPFQNSVSARRWQNARGRDADTQYEEFESMCEAHVTRPQPHTVARLKQSTMPPAQPKKKKRDPAHLIPFRRRNAPRPCMKNRKIPKSKIGRWRSELSARSRDIMSDDTSVKSSCERISAALKNFIDLVNVFVDGESVQRLFDPFKEQMDEIESLRLKLKATPCADSWTGLAMIDDLEDCLEASIKVSIEKATAQMIDLYEAHKLSKTSSVASTIEPAPV